MAFYAGDIKAILFGQLGPDDQAEINPVSGYIRYTKSSLGKTDSVAKARNLPQTKGEAQKAALAFLREKHAEFLAFKSLQDSVTGRHGQGQPLKQGFAPVPHPDWLRLVSTYLVSNTKAGVPDHWCCKYAVELPLPSGRATLLNSELDIRVGMAHLGISPAKYEIVGFSMRYRPIVYQPVGPLDYFLPDIGNPEHEEDDAHGDAHMHLNNETRIAYILDDAHAPQPNLLPYEVTIGGGHHLSVLPASTRSLWIEWRVETTPQNYVIQALIMGGSGTYKGNWGYWKPFSGIRLDGTLALDKATPKAHFEHSTAYPGVAISTFTLPLGSWEFGISVEDTVHGNVIHKVHSLSLQTKPFTPPAEPIATPSLNA